jgi:hypothetical protein
VAPVLIEVAADDRVEADEAVIVKRATELVEAALSFLGLGEPTARCWGATPY